MYYYRIFGLLAAAEFVFPEARQITQLNGQEADVTIKLGKISFELLSHPKTQNPMGIWHYCFPDSRTSRFAFRALGIEMEVTDGERITVSPPASDSSPEKLRTLILGTAFGVIGMQRGLLPIHGAAIEAGDNAFIITGSAGSGKSTLLEFFISRGFRYLSDDVSFVSVDGSTPFVIPAYPQRKLAADAENLCSSRDESMLINEDGRDKYVIRSQREWCPKKLPLGGIVELMPGRKVQDSSPYLTVAPVEGHRSLALVLNNLYRPYFYKDTGISAAAMKKILTAARCSRIYRAVRSIDNISPVQLGQEIMDTAINIYKK